MGAPERPPLEPLHGPDGLGQVWEASPSFQQLALTAFLLLSWEFLHKEVRQLVSAFQTSTLGFLICSWGPSCSHLKGPENKESKVLNTPHLLCTGHLDNVFTGTVQQRAPYLSLPKVF